MRDAVEKFLEVLSYSKRTQIAICLGVIFFFGIILLGQHMTSQFDISSQLGSAKEVIKEKLLQRYDKAAFVTLFGFMMLAVRTYLKDRKKLLGM